MYCRLRRYMGRVLCHAYNNGLVRSAVENRNLRAYARDHDVTFAESFRTCKTTVFCGREYMAMVDKTAKQGDRVLHFERDMRNPAQPKLTARNTALLYGHRPVSQAGLLYLSPYEFTMYWEPQLLKYPRSEEEDLGGKYEARLTVAGRRKLRLQVESELVPGLDYVVKDEGGCNWVALENGPVTATLRHEWILRKRARPVAPHFKGCPLPKHSPFSAERNAQITLTYFHPWTLREEAWSDAHVPTIQHLKQDCETWVAALTQWLDGHILCEESKRYVSNFISMHRLRPCDEDEDGAANPDDMVEDEDVYVTKDMLDEVLDTRIGGKARQNNDTDEIGDGHHINSNEAVGLGRDIWAKVDDTASNTTQPTFSFDQEKLQQSLQSAKTSRGKENKFATHGNAQTRADREATLSHRYQATQEDVQKWMDELASRRHSDGRSYVNAKQLEAIAKVAHKVMADLPNRQGIMPEPSRPLRWVLHGGPGTGKTHVIKDVIHSRRGSEEMQTLKIHETSD